MKKTAFALSIGIAFGLALTCSAVLASSAKLKDVSCEEFLAMDEDNQNAIVYWIDGVATATDASDNKMAAADIDVGYDMFGNPVTAVVDACTADKKASLWEKVKEHFHSKK